MRRVAVWLVAISLSMLLAAPTARGQSDQKLDLSVLYAGHPGSEREKDFLQFLRLHFREVQTGDLGKFNGRQQADVVLLDYDGDGFTAPRVALPPGYSRPTVTIGVVGGLIAGQLRLKTGYM